MKLIKFITHRTKFCLLFLTTSVILGACSDDDNSSMGGNPVVSVGDIQPAYFGDSITVNVNCSDNVALSTLKATLKYSEEEVENVTLRTKENGNYAVKLYMPFYKDVPDGNATLHLTLQNIEFTKTEQDVTIPVSRPHYDHLTLYVDKNTQYNMTPDNDNPFLYRCTVHSPSSTVVSGKVIAPAFGDNGNQIIFGQSTDGTSITQGAADPIPFTGEAKGDFECTFNTLTYEYSRLCRKLPWFWLKQYLSKFWIDPDFFTPNSDGSYTFNAVDGNYHLKVSTDRLALLVWATDANKKSLTLDNDGSGALWIIGSDGIGKPAYKYVKGESWWTDIDHAICMAQISPKVYQVTLTIGQQLDPDNVNFKFFGQQGWGTEFKGTESDHHISTTSSLFVVGDGKEHDVNGTSVKLDDGNIYLTSADAVKNGETYVLTVDLTGGCNNAILKVTKK